MTLSCSRLCTVELARRPSRVVFVSVALLLLPLAWVISAESAQEQRRAPRWFRDADTLIAQLLRLDLKTPYQFDAFPSERAEQADRILWKLWLTTGMPPSVQGDNASFETHVRENAVAYRQYIEQHRHLTLRELQRQGLSNAIDSYGSSLWYMTKRYLAEKASVQSKWKTAVATISPAPTPIIVNIPLPQKVYAKHSANLAAWLKANEKQLVWDADAEKFRPRNGKYLGTDALFRRTMKVHLESYQDRSPRDD